MAAWPQSSRCSVPACLGDESDLTGWKIPVSLGRTGLCRAPSPHTKAGAGLAPLLLFEQWELHSITCWWPASPSHGAGLILGRRRGGHALLPIAGWGNKPTLARQPTPWGKRSLPSSRWHLLLEASCLPLRRPPGIPRGTCKTRKAQGHSRFVPRQGKEFSRLLGNDKGGVTVKKKGPENL